jgi:NhaA family Na+:H+ antiporter
MIRMATSGTRRSAVAEFLRTEAAGGVVVVIAALVALVWANSPWKASYETLWETHLAIILGDHSLDLTLRDWVNEGLMAIFFFVVGLEIKRELVEGELSDRRRAAVPAIAAIGGMLVPALIYLLLNSSGAGRDGWGIPIATDIAIAVGVMSLLGSRVSSSLKVFLLALAIVDDIGAIVVIAFVYSDTIHLDALAVALVLLFVVLLCQRRNVRLIPVYVVLGAAVWLALHEAGVHSTVTGVLLGLMAPAQPLRRPEDVSEENLRDVSTPENARETVVLARESISIVAWLELLLHRWSSLVIVPIFALANAGIPLSADAVSDALSSRIAWGVALGLGVGKLVGITSFAWLAVRSRIGTLAPEVRGLGLTGLALLGGIGFTVSIFVTGLAFDSVALQDEAKIGILAASLVSGGIGAALLAVSAARTRARQ